MKYDTNCSHSSRRAREERVKEENYNLNTMITLSIQDRSSAYPVSLCSYNSLAAGFWCLPLHLRGGNKVDSALQPLK